MRMKYIVTEREENGNRIEEIFVFDCNINHDAYAELVGKFKNQTWGNWKRVPRKPISAGFVTIRQDRVECYGKSETLNLESRNEVDTKLLAGVL